MLRALGLAVSDLSNGRILAILLQALAVSVVVFLLIAALLLWLLAGSDPCSLVGIDSCPLDIGTGAIGAVGLTILAAWFLFPAVAIGVITTFADRIGAAVEERHYPEAAAEARPIGIAGGAAMGLKSAGRLILNNVVALPFYLLLLVTGVGPFILFVIVNGVAFGRDVAELAAARHGDRNSRREWLKHTRWQQHLIGVAVTILFLIPIANLLAPVIGTSAGIHLFNGSFWRKTGLGRAAIP